MCRWSIGSLFQIIDHNTSYLVFEPVLILSLCPSSVSSKFLINKLFVLSLIFIGLVCPTLFYCWHFLSFLKVFVLNSSTTDCTKQKPRQNLPGSYFISNDTRFKSIDRFFGHWQTKTFPKNVKLFINEIKDMSFDRHNHDHQGKFRKCHDAYEVLDVLRGWIDCRKLSPACQFTRTHRILDGFIGCVFV